MSSNGGSSRGQVSVMEALGRIESRAVKERTEGLNDLRHILRHNRDNAEIMNFKDKSFHKIFEVLFTAAFEERTAYLKSLNHAKNVKSGAATRFSNCSQTLRLAVDAGVRNIRLKTLNALLDHITETIIDADGECCEPIALDYARCLSAVLAYEPHVEHLKEAQWRKVAMFCLDVVKSATPANVPASSPISTTRSIVNRPSFRSSRTSVLGSQAPDTGRSLPKQALDEFVICIRYLTSSPSAPLLRESKLIVTTMLRYLEVSHSVGQAQISALAAVNNTLLQLRADKIDSTSSLVQPCIRASKNIWSSKVIAIKDELLVMLVLLHPYIRHLLTAGDWSLGNEIELLLEHLRGEYARRDIKDQLRLEDLHFSLSPQSSCKTLRCEIFSLRDGTSIAASSYTGEHNWTLLQLLTCLATSAPKDRAWRDGSSAALEKDVNKRQRISHWSDEYLHLLHDPHVSTKISALQLLCFTAQNVAIDEDMLERVMDKASAMITDDNPLLASWSLITLASCATQASAAARGLSGKWNSVWHLAARSVNTAATCRASCHTMHAIMQIGLIERSQILDTCNSMLLAIEVNGPSSFSDSVSSFLVSVVHHLHRENLQSSKDGFEKVLTWLFRAWAPSSFQDKVFASRNSNTEVADVINLINACLGRPQFKVASHTLIPIWGTVAQAWIMHERDRELLDYLLQKDTRAPFSITWSNINDTATLNAAPSSNESLVLGLCQGEISRAVEQIDHMKDQRGSNMNRDMIHLLSTLAVAAVCLSRCHTIRDTRRADQLRQINDKLLDSLFHDLSSVECEQSKLDSLFGVLAHYMTFSGSDGLTNSKNEHECMSTLAPRVTNLVNSRQESGRFGSLTQDDEFGDFMDLDTQYTFETSRRQRTNEQTFPRRVVQSTYHPSTRTTGIAAWAMFAQNFRPSEQNMDVDSSSGAFIKYLSSLSDRELLASRPMVVALHECSGKLKPDDTDQILNRIENGPLRSYEYERSEVTHALLLDVMILEISNWTNPGNTTLYETGREFYFWLTETALTADMLSITAQKRLCKMLLLLQQIDPDYGQNDDLPSIRTTLFSMFGNSRLEVRHFLASRLSAIFGLYTLANHDNVFDDLSSSLPTDIEWTEGIAIRLLVLSYLASSWHSLLRRCIYGIFETAGQIQSSVSYATHCVLQISVSLGLKGSQDLFKLFAPQLLFTWLDASRPLDKIPYEIFSYDTMIELLEQNLDEVFSQLIICNRPEDMRWLSETLRMPEDRMLRRTFSKAMAYAISWDVVFDKDGTKRCESHLRNLIKTKGEYHSLIQTNFPYILAQFYLSLDMEELAEKTLEKRPKYQYTADALRAMKSYSFSERPLPSTQQPHFKGKYLPDQMERAARRSSPSKDVGPIAQELSSSRLTVILRSLLDAMHPALGPLHACQIVRKIRLVVAFAGEEAVKGYPLEMLLLSLRPLAVDLQCADDVLGLLHYLFDRGQVHLKQNISTLLSTALLLLISLKGFIGSRQENTTQETQFRATVSKMNAFHGWLMDYLSGCVDAFQDDKDSSRRTAFSSLVQSCGMFTLPASADKGNTSSAMIKVLIDDEKSPSPLLVPTERKEILSLLCCSFEPPESSTDDLFGSDGLSELYARDLWSSTRASAQACDFETWTAQVLGRAFASSVNPELIRPAGRLQPEFLHGGTGEIGSVHAIAAKLRESLQSDDRSTVSTAERTLRGIIGRFQDLHDHDGLIGFEKLFPSHVCFAMAEAYISEHERVSLGRNSLVTNAQKDELLKVAKLSPDLPVEQWAQAFAVTISGWINGSAILSPLVDFLKGVDNSAYQLFPFVVHLALESEQGKEQVIRNALSESFMEHFEQEAAFTESKPRLMLETILHLLTQPIPQEQTRLDRLRWLDIDYITAAAAAQRCKMPTTALYLIELAMTPNPSSETEGHVSRRSTMGPSAVNTPPYELLLSIYKTVDDPDSFYGVQQAPSLQSVLDRIDHEKDGLKGMMFHAARMDASLRRRGQVSDEDSLGIIKSMGAMNLNSLTHGLLSQRKGIESDVATTTSMLDSARKLQQWDVAPPQDAISDSSRLYSVFRSLAATTNFDNFKTDLSKALRDTSIKLREPQLDAVSIRSTLATLAILTEVNEMMSVKDYADMTALWDRMQTRQQSWDIGRFNDAKHIISYRETLFSTLSRNPHLRDALHISSKDSLEIEVRAVVNSSEFSRKNDLIQQSLAAATYLSELVPTCADIGLKIDAVAQFQAASILWMQGEISSSVQMLQDLRERTDLDKQTLKVGSAGLLAQLGHEVAEARLEKPEEIITQYLKPAIAQLETVTTGSEAGRVFFEFATFCDQQLQNPGNIEDFQRLERLSQRRLAELHQYKTMIDSTPASQKDNKRNLKSAALRVQQWYNLDNQEYQKARTTRDEFVRQSLENYLRALKACDDFNSSVVRFFALWLEYSDSDSANRAVEEALQQVPSWKFVGLTNQLNSRLLDDESRFQKSLSRLVGRMCLDHPYHMMYNIYAGVKGAVNKTDEKSNSRQKAATKLARTLQDAPGVGTTIQHILAACESYVKLAQTKVEQKRGQRILLSNVKVAAEMDRHIRRLGVPPATLHLELRPNADYHNIPIVTRFRSEIKIAGGLSAPKILVAVATDGKEYKQLFKGGNDDLRQDAIMEQVFDEVSKMLQNHKATRQRNINIRTYKVLPLTSNTGIIEFVPNSVPLAEFLNPAHRKYHPGDLKQDQARSKIAEVAKMTKEVRIKTYKEVAARYQPVLRHFFFELFYDPDEWFQRRLAYTRSTAAISILGHVLGLGDRHTQNILLDEKSGEVIHIDLGVAFEAGRVLPIPEVVPFRLSRDIVDGMGITKTEGVFRRCCEFTMEALREEADGIMTLLNVLRYDPLYTWTLSPLRAKRIQEAQEETEDGLEVPGSKRREDEASEADRALSVVEKKLSKTLSVAATVNELIQQASDERNLAVLFAGWAAFA